MRVDRVLFEIVEALGFNVERPFLFPTVGLEGAILAVG